MAHHDNPVDNRASPEPTAGVRWGNRTWEEMMIGFYGTEELDVGEDDRRQLTPHPA